jgi:PII-like signaling protein
MMQKMWCLTVRRKRNDKFRGKRLEGALIDFLMGAKICGATVWTGVDGFGKYGRSTMYLEGIIINMPVIIEVIDEKSKLEPLLPQIRRMIGDNGLVTLHEVNVI